MSSVPFLFVNLIAMCGYAIIFVSFIAAKKTPEIKAFIALLTSFMLWTIGSILMRLQMYPGLNFWYYVSILALFCIADLTYIFVCSFTKTKATFTKIIWSVGTVIILIFTANGVFLKPPVPVDTARGTVFTYNMDWKVVIPYIFFGFIVASIAIVIRQKRRETGTRSPGMNAMTAGCIIIALGNLLQIIPGNVFPYDTLSGIITIIFLVWAMYRKRMFRLTLLVSRGVVVCASLIICLFASVNLVIPLSKILISKFELSYEVSTSVIILCAVVLIAAFYLCLCKLVNALFTREEQQNRLINSFSQKVSQTLESLNIMALLSDTIKQEIATSNIYICMHEGNEYKFGYVSSPLASASFSLRDDTPCVEYAKMNETCFSMRDFESSSLYLSMWDSEKMLLKQLDISCILALKDNDNVVGLVLLARKEKNNSYTTGEMDFLATLGSISAIAMKNAGLYEQVAREARTDAMTGIYNYRYFMQVIKSEFNRENRDNLALLLIDIDDFKLYNQLYGSNDGDNVLKRVAEILQQLTVESGYAFRYSGKVFAIILPGYDARMAKSLALHIQSEVGKINGRGIRASHKKITASCGICVAPHAATTCSELIDNADLAVFKAKSGGKDNIVVFKSNDSITYNLHKKVERLSELSKDTILGESSQTIFALIAAIDAKDHYTAQHSKNVARYAAILAAANGMSDDQIRMIFAAGLLHDIGKISIPESILGKTGKLTDEEFETMKGHVNCSIEMIKHLPSMDYLVPVAVGHHERWDGKGYPRGTAGEDIPVSARCLAIADSFDAMTTDRPYRKGMSIEYAAKEIKKGGGTQFDPELAELFVKLIEENEIIVQSQIDIN
ncbi:MAG: diguanylate cyclase [Bacillota bacterium]|nr:diguanylate cyclase [Bacillota bacterium]